MVSDFSKLRGLHRLLSKKSGSLANTRQLPRRHEDLDNSNDIRVHQKQTSKQQSSTASQFRQVGKAFRRGNENPPLVGSRKGPPALGEGQRRLRAERARKNASQARKNASPLCHAAPLADKPTKPPRIIPKRLPSSEVTSPAHAPTRTPLRRIWHPARRLMGYKAHLCASLQSGYSRLTT
jgi:hypothetical protein